MDRKARNQFRKVFIAGDMGLDQLLVADGGDRDRNVLKALASLPACAKA
jgi:hypothetical protein